MKFFIPIVLLVASCASSAQVVRTQPGFCGFDSGDVCYQWSGGHGSAGAFSRCQPSVQIAILNHLPPPVQPSPIMMPQSAPITCAPPPKPILHKKRPAPKKC